MKGFDKIQAHMTVTLKKLEVEDVNINFMCQFGWAILCTYLGKHYSGWFCKGGSWMRLTLK